MNTIGLIILLVILLVIGLVLVLFCKLLYFILVLIFIFFVESDTVDTAKLNASYFIGEYQTDYKNEIEKITLKENGYYDYAHGKDNDTIVENAGKWDFDNFSETRQLIELTGFPLIRKNVDYERVVKDTAKSINKSLFVNNSVGYLGDLFSIDADENHYTFVKLDKSKNKDYIIKRQKQ
ncbi:MAG: hypothetical protein CRN43_02205 [Candidatus Nephrothrix sp. EaCA]|nr:MAG: hypothetical protein CRN43_02205 [Candidatus Nephrothrix sp. EaCA]